jgi:hypothetical protein
LDGGAVDLLKVADNYKKHFLSVSKTGTMQEMWDAFYAFQISEGCCQKTLADDRCRLKKFVKAFGHLDPRELKPSDLFNWVHGFTAGNQSNMFKAAKKLLRWAKRTGYLGIDLMDDMEWPDSESSKGFLKIPDFESLLRVCAGIDPLPRAPANLKPQYGYKIITDFRPALAAFVLGGFAAMNATDGLFLALRASGPIDRAESCRSAEVRNRDSLPPIGLNSGSETKNGSGSRRYGFHLRCRIILWRGFIVRMINSTSLSGSYFVIGTLCNHVPQYDDIGIQ